MTITQTIEVPDDHRVFFEFLAPREIPAGKARVEMKVTPVVEKQEKPALSVDEGASPHPNSDALSEILSRPSPHTDALFALFAPIRGTVDVDEIRTERIMAKHLK
ncbi:MAG: hypothetical protein LBQ94_01175 [Treponema sp.]|jgi:hypothetical protein|nr:hypothetical protein [Treponema sp.]